MINVLTIDFDIMLWKSIELYNGIAGGASWEEIEQNELLRFVQFDSQIYELLTQIICKISKKIPKENVHFITSHQRVIKYIPQNELIELTNIDHHHDLQYNDSNNIDILTCGNWVKYLFEHNYNISKYIWINDPNSIYCQFDSKKYCHQSDIIQSYDLTMTDYDMVIICLSPPWVPPQYRPLYTAWMDMLNRIYNTTFAMDD